MNSAAGPDGARGSAPRGRPPRAEQGWRVLALRAAREGCLQAHDADPANKTRRCQGDCTETASHGLHCVSFLKEKKKIKETTPSSSKQGFVF